MRIDSETVAQEVLMRSEPLSRDTQEREEFYRDLGVVRTQLERMTVAENPNVWVKDEGAQPIGAYKLRGAMWMVSQAVAEQHHAPLTELHTVSTGNNGRAAGYAAKHFNLHSVVHAPDSITPEKASAIQDIGSQLVVYPSFEDAKEEAVSRGAQVGALFLPPFDHYDILSGQSSLGYELVEDLKAKSLADKDVDVVVSVAGGGQISGYAIPIMQAKRLGELGENIRVIGVQPEGTDAMRRTIQHIRNQTPLPKSLFKPEEFDTFCDALAIQNVGTYPTAIVADTAYVHRVETIDKLSIASAMHELFDKSGVWFEPAAAITYAYAQQHSHEKGKNFVLSLSGVNVARATIDYTRRLIADARWHQFQQDFQSPTNARYDPVRESGENARKRAPQSGTHPALGGHSPR